MNDLDSKLRALADRATDINGDLITGEYNLVRAAADLALEAAADWTARYAETFTAKGFEITRASVAGCANGIRALRTRGGST